MFTKVALNIEWDLEEWELVNEIAISKWGEEVQLFLDSNIRPRPPTPPPPLTDSKYAKRKAKLSKTKKKKQKRLTGFFDKRMFSSKFIQSSDLFI